jgi:phosphoglycolate phosphatase
VQISVVVTDLDNTLFDWVEIWYRSFSALLDSLLTQSGVPEETLIREIRTVHQRHGTSEYAFLIEELPSLRKLHPGESLGMVYRQAIDAFDAAREQALQLYPGVFDALAQVRRSGCLIVGYTESMALYTNYRVRKLGLDGLLDYLYSPADHTIPRGLSADQLRRYPVEQCRFAHTIHYHLPRGEHKPNPRVLLDIITSLGAVPEEVVYVGDSLMKDISMAQDAGVPDVHAAYGVAQHRAAYELLRSVSHWTDADVEREKQILHRGQVTPSYTLRNSFSELLGLFEFVPSPQAITQQ